MFRVILVLALTSVALSGPAWASDAGKHSGRIVAIRSDTIALEEIGPWTEGVLRTTKRTIELPTTASIELLARMEQPGPGQWPGGFRGSALTASDLRVGDYVTVTTESREGHLVATSVDVIRPSEDFRPTTAPRAPRSSRL